MADASFPDISFVLLKPSVFIISCRSVLCVPCHSVCVGGCGCVGVGGCVCGCVCTMLVQFSVQKLFQVVFG